MVGDVVQIAGAIADEEALGEGGIREEDAGTRGRGDAEMGEDEDGRSRMEDGSGAVAAFDALSSIVACSQSPCPRVPASPRPVFCKSAPPLSKIPSAPLTTTNSSRIAGGSGQSGIGAIVRLAGSRPSARRFLCACSRRRG